MTEGFVILPRVLTPELAEAIASSMLTAETVEDLWASVLRFSRPASPPGEPDYDSEKIHATAARIMPRSMAAMKEYSDQRQPARSEPASPPGEPQPDFEYFECPECEFNSVQKRPFDGGTACPLCAGDSGHDVTMRRRTALSTDKPEGHDARKDARQSASSEQVCPRCDGTGRSFEAMTLEREFCLVCRGTGRTGGGDG